MFLSNRSRLAVVSTPEYLKARVLADAVSSRDAFRKAVDESVVRRTLAHRLVADVLTASEASQSMVGRRRDGKGSKAELRPAQPARPTEALKAQDGSTASQPCTETGPPTWPSWIDGMAVACAPINFDTSMERMATACLALDRRHRARLKPRGATRTRESDTLDLAPSRLAQEAKLPVRREADPPSMPTLKTSRPESRRTKKFSRSYLAFTARWPTPCLAVRKPGANRPGRREDLSACPHERT